MKYIKLFKSIEEYENAYINGLELPSLVAVVNDNTKKAFYHKRKGGATVKNDYIAISNDILVKENTCVFTSGSVENNTLIL